MRCQPLFYAEKLEKSLLLAFKIESNILIFSLKRLSLQQFAKDFYLGAENSVLYDHMRQQPHFQAAM